MNTSHRPYSRQPKKYRVGARFGRLTITERVAGKLVRVRCDCGAEKLVLSNILRDPHASCGCVPSPKIAQGRCLLAERWG